PRAERVCTRAVEADGEQRAVEERERPEGGRRQAAGEDEVGRRYAEQIAEEEVPDPGRRGGGEGQHDAEPEEARDHDCDGRVASDRPRPAEDRDGGRGAGDADRAPEDE